MLYHIEASLAPEIVGEHALELLSGVSICDMNDDRCGWVFQWSGPYKAPSRESP
jgi:hypothetical protein